MSKPEPLPQALLKAGFTVAEAKARGVSASRLRASDLHAPYVGVRTIGVPSSLEEQAYALSLCLDERHAISGLTALRLWGMPLPSRLRERETPLEVLTDLSGSRVDRSGVTTRRIRRSRFRAVTLHGIRLVSPVLAMITAIRHLDVEWTTVLLEALLAESSLYPSLRFAERPHLVPFQLDGLLQHFSGMDGMTKLRAAAEQSRTRVESPMESVLRLRLIGAGLPEPAIQPELVLPGGERVRPDLGYRHAAAYLDYEGEHHARDPEIFERDLRRSRAMREAGLEHIRVTRSDLHRQHFPRLVANLRSLIFRRM
ncbi:hypothetical protein [Gulosibacter sp. 10]|uniref:hypothetical protein n=1 Tax=Gulosibacter sp. 10 TaxID=1255570 RepID=UPI0011217A14|nr:hypothetical protein [Gulosibacter sp. 10]